MSSNAFANLSEIASDSNVHAASRPYPSPPFGLRRTLSPKCLLKNECMPTSQLMSQRYSFQSKSGLQPMNKLCALSALESVAEEGIQIEDEECESCPRPLACRIPQIRRCIKEEGVESWSDFPKVRKTSTNKPARRVSFQESVASDEESHDEQAIKLEKSSTALGLHGMANFSEDEESDYEETEVKVGHKIGSDKLISLSTLESEDSEDHLSYYPSPAPSPDFRTSSWSLSQCDENTELVAISKEIDFKTLRTIHPHGMPMS